MMEILLRVSRFLRRALRGPDGLRDPARRDVHRRRDGRGREKAQFNRLASMVEASLWVVGGLLIANALHLLGKMPAGYAVTYVTILGGALLGLGAYVNKACVFGAIARLGSGEWAYVVTPIGFYAGCANVRARVPVSRPAEAAFRVRRCCTASTWCRRVLSR